MTELIPEKFYVCTGDITKIQADAVVNAANSSLLGGGGVDGAIHAAGGRTILAACRQLREIRYPDGLPPGAAAATTAGRLRATWVIHTVGPVWKDGTRGEPELLESAYRSSTAEAQRLGCGTVAFPAVSTGAYGFPKKLAAEIVWRTLSEIITENPGSIRKIYLVFFAAKDEELFVKTVRSLGGYACP